MNLIDTVSTILNKEVTEDGAKDFAMRQFGMLAAYLRENPKNTIDYYVKKLIQGETVVILSESERKEVQKRLHEIKKNATLVLSQFSNL